MKLRKTPPTNGLVGIAMHVLFCLFFLLGGFGFLCCAACLPPILEVQPAGLGAGRAFKLVDYPSNGLRDMRYRNLEVAQTTPHTENTAVLECRVESVGSLNVELPLLCGEFASDVVDDLALLGLTSGAGREIVEQRGDARSGGDPTGGNKSDLNRSIESVDYHFGAFVAGAGGTLLGLVLGFFIFRQNSTY